MSIDSCDVADPSPLFVLLRVTDTLTTSGDRVVVTVAIFSTQMANFWIALVQLLLVGSALFLAVLGGIILNSGLRTRASNAALLATQCTVEEILLFETVCSQSEDDFEPCTYMYFIVVYDDMQTAAVKPRLLKMTPENGPNELLAERPLNSTHLCFVSGVEELQVGGMDTLAEAFWTKPSEAHVALGVNLLLVAVACLILPLVIFGLTKLYDKWEKSAQERLWRAKQKRRKERAVAASPIAVPDSWEASCANCHSALPKGVSECSSCRQH